MVNKINILGVDIEYDENNIKVIDSYKIKKRDLISDILVLFKLETGYVSKRNLVDWVSEWVAHNRLYTLGLFRSHTKDVDLEENEKRWRKIIYKILGW
jgi:hypothetical protein